jgi:ribulose-phosphate 3-epimerase
MIDFIKNNYPLLSVGILSANLMNLEKDIDILEKNNIKLLHFDVMDGNFVPQLTIGHTFVKAVKTKLFKDVHLMIKDPYNFIPYYISAGADIITLHLESGNHIRACLRLISTSVNVNDVKRKIACGLAITPATPISSIEPFLPDIDIITLIGVNPGYYNETFYDDTIERAFAVKKLIAESKKDIFLCIDGGITKEVIKKVSQVDPHIVVSGSAIFEKNNVKENIQIMQNYLLKKNKE